MGREGRLTTAHNPPQCSTFDRKRATHVRANPTSNYNKSNYNGVQFCDDLEATCQKVDEEEERQIGGIGTILI